GSTNSNPSTPGNGRVGSRECTACLKSAVSASRGHISNNVTTPLPFRKRERTRQGFRSVGSLQHFVSIFSAVRNLFVPSQTNRSAAQIRTHRRQAMAAWEAVSALPA
ncbi:hypothetical protein MJ877_36275, partial [Mesorhizobium jarvisii]|nr:hypothetical protein [Mesorhizobium jarvisii]